MPPDDSITATLEPEPPPAHRTFRAALFDLDGVLVDTAAFHYRAWRELALELGFDFPPSANEQLKGVSRQQSLEILLAHGGVTASAGEKAALAERKNRAYVALLQTLGPESLLPGARECLLELRRRGIKLALGSVSQNAALVLDRLGLAPLFDAVIDGTKIARSKPDPEVFLRGAEALGVAPADCVVFEDAAAGIEAARRAGMSAVGIGAAAVLGAADLVVAGLHALELDALFPAPAPGVTGENIFHGIDLAAKPFHLDGESVAWVRRTFAGLTIEEKLGQLFCLVVRENDAGERFDEIFRLLRPGGFMLRPRNAASVLRAHRELDARSPVPLLLAANLERGGNGIADDGTHFSSPMGIAATDDEQHAYHLGLVSGREGRALGCNWAFAPVADIDFNPHNPITNTRTYGSDPARVLRMTRACVRGLHECGLAVSVKHWPGDGVDARDQHLVTSVNTLPVEEWERTFGAVYRGLVDDGAATIMAAHIMLPEYSRRLVPGIRDADILPASLAPELTRLLREQIGFNGLVVSDATNMVGFTAAMPRARAVPAAIEAGCDMFLFTVELESDFAFMRDGLRSGLLSARRLDEAVTRILALKASLGLPRRRAAGTLLPPDSALAVLRCEEHVRWARECAARAVTLVKDRQPVLPLTPQRHRRLLVRVMGDQGGYMDNGGGNADEFIRLLGAAGFAVTLYDAGRETVRTVAPAAALRAQHDAIIYFASLKTASNQTVVRLNWGVPLAFDAPHHIHELPTLFISIDNPYHLQDVPRMKTFVNAYTSNRYAVEAVVDKLLGRSAFNGQSPIDPTCGYWDARL